VGERRKRKEERWKAAWEGRETGWRLPSPFLVDWPIQSFLLLLLLLIL